MEMSGTEVLRESLDMARMVSGSFVRRIESLFEGGSVAGLSDRQLLERFNGERDATGETAFRRAGDPARTDGAARLPAAPG